MNFFLKTNDLDLLSKYKEEAARLKHKICEILVFLNSSDEGCEFLKKERQKINQKSSNNITKDNNTVATATVTTLTAPTIPVGVDSHSAYYEYLIPYAPTQPVNALPTTEPVNALPYTNTNTNEHICNHTYVCAYTV